jgi:hypothetical protein
MNVESGTEAAQFPEKDVNSIFFGNINSLKCYFWDRVYWRYIMDLYLFDNDQAQIYSAY